MLLFRNELDTEEFKLTDLRAHMLQSQKDQQPHGVNSSLPLESNVSNTTSDNQL